MEKRVKVIFRGWNYPLASNFWRGERKLTSLLLDIFYALMEFFGKFLLMEVNFFLRNTFLLGNLLGWA